MTTIVKVGVGAAIIGAVVAGFIPAIKGPINRFRLEANDKLNAEYVVDNYKAEYVKLYEKKKQLLASIQKFNVEKKVSEKKLVDASNKVEVAKKYLMSVGTSDMVAFNQAKEAYETFKAQVNNYTTMVKTYGDAAAKLEKSLAVVSANMTKCKLNVDTLASKKIMVDTIKTVNSTIENMNGTGDTDLAVNVEKLDDDLMRESIKLEALDNTTVTTKPMSEAEAKAYLDSIK